MFEYGSAGRNSGTLHQTKENELDENHCPCSVAIKSGIRSVMCICICICNVWEYQTHLLCPDVKTDLSSTFYGLFHSVLKRLTVQSPKCCLHRLDGNILGR